MTRIVPSEEEIRQRAYEIHLARNGGLGDALSDWLQAESEVRVRRALLDVLEEFPHLNTSEWTP